MDDPRRLMRAAANALKRGEAEHDFFELVRRADSTRPDLPRTGHARHLTEELLRFAQQPSLSFPETSVARIDLAGDSGELARILVYFFGLFGPGGPMPLELTNFVLSRSVNSFDRTHQRFADIIHHRFIELFYRAWAQMQEAVQFDRPGDNLLGKAILSLTGTPAGEAALGLPSFSARAFCRFLAGNMPRSADGLETLLAFFTGVPIRVTSAVEGSYDMPPECWARLGERDTSVLGENIQLGRRYTSRTRKFRITAGPLSQEEASRLMPGEPGFDGIAELIRLYLTQPFDCELVLVIRGPTIRARGLGCGAVLGRSAWCATPGRALKDTRIVLDASAIARRCRNAARRAQVKNIMEDTHEQA